jgi:hypothetical protein
LMSRLKAPPKGSIYYLKAEERLSTLGEGITGAARVNKR